MQESYSEGVATHAGPESCAIPRKDDGEALTGVRAGRVLSRETKLPRRKTTGPPGCRRRSDGRKATPDTSISRDVAGPRAVRDPEHGTETSCTGAGRSHVCLRWRAPQTASESP